MRIEILTHILEVTKMQMSALKEEDIDKWSKLVVERQIYIDELETLNKGNQIGKMEEEEKLLREIIVIDKDNRQEFDRQYEEVQQKLKQIHSQKKVGNAYSNPYDISQEEGIFFDKR